MPEIPSPAESPDPPGLPSSSALPALHPALRTLATRALFTAFEREDAKLQARGSQMAVMFLGAMAARYQTDNPEHLIQATHSLRELMEKMPRYHGIAPVAAEGLTSRVREVLSFWQPVSAVTEDGEIRAGLIARFCDAFAAFAAWFVDRDMPRREQTGQLFGRMDQRRERLPKGIERHRIGEWGEYEGYFIGVSHHTRTTTTEEFDAMLAGFAEFALGYLRPRTFEDQAALKDTAGGAANA